MAWSTKLLKMTLGLSMLTTRIGHAISPCALEIPLKVIDTNQTTDIRMQCPSKNSRVTIRATGNLQQVGLFTDEGWRPTTEYWKTWPMCANLKKLRFYGNVDGDITVYAEIKDTTGQTVCKTNEVTITRSQEMMTYQQRVNEKLVPPAEAVSESTPRYKPTANVQNAIQKPNKIWIKIEGASVLLAIVLGLGSRLRRNDKIRNA